MRERSFPGWQGAIGSFEPHGGRSFRLTPMPISRRSRLVSDAAFIGEPWGCFAT